MKYLHLVWSNLWRRKLRTPFTLLSIVVAFVLFGLLVAVRTAFTAGVDVSGADRMMVTHKVSFILPLPFSYRDRIAARARGQGGLLHELVRRHLPGPQELLPPDGGGHRTFLDLYPEYVLPAEQKKAWLADRTGAIVGRVTADRFGWKVGDQIPIQATSSPSGRLEPVEFNLVGIYDGAQKATDTSASTSTTTT